MAEGTPKHLNALDQRLRNYCKQVGLDFQRARNHMGALVALTSRVCDCDCGKLSGIGRNRARIHRNPHHATANILTS